MADRFITKVQTTKVDCYLCGSSDKVFVAEGKDREYYVSDQVFKVVECCSCGLRYLNPRPTRGELSKIYPPSYYSYNMDADPNNLGLASKLRHLVHGRRFKKLINSLDNRKKIDLLDVGCGDGWMLYLFKAADPERISTFGVDINEEVCKKARERGHKIYCSLYEDAQFEQKFDVINLSNVLEHVIDPVGVVKKSFQSLNEGGLLILETPNYDSWDGKYFKRSGDWGSYHFPRHFTFFNPATIQKLATDHGFFVEHIEFSPAPTQWVWTIHNLLLGSRFGLFRWLAPIFEPDDCFKGGIKPFVLLSALAVCDSIAKVITGQTSNMTAVLQKEQNLPS